MRGTEGEFRGDVPATDSSRTWQQPRLLRADKTHMTEKSSTDVCVNSEEIVRVSRSIEKQLSTIDEFGDVHLNVRQQKFQELTCGDISLFTGPHQISFSDPGSLTILLSRGDRPVFAPEYAVRAPDDVMAEPVSYTRASSYRAATEGFGTCVEKDRWSAERS